MSRLGMDADVVAQVGQRLKSAAANLSSISVGITRLVDQAGGVWDGPDSRAFADAWTHSHRPAFMKAVNAIEGLGQSALNNVSDQRHTSDSAAGGLLAGVVGVVGVVGVAAGQKKAEEHGQASSGPGAPPSPMSSSATNFRDSIVGKHIDYDGQYGAQCFDVFQKYNREVVGGPFIGGGGAHEIYDSYATNGAAADYARVPANAGPPQLGDVAVWSASSPQSGGFGHVAIVTSVSGGSFQVVEQNGNNPGGVAYTENRNAADPYLLGYLRPKH